MISDTWGTTRLKKSAQRLRQL